MASIARDPNGRKRVLFVAPDGKRKAIRPGRVPQKAAEKVKHKVESPLAAKITGDAIDADTARWVADLPDDLADKLAAVGLIPERHSSRLGEFLERYVQSRIDLKPLSVVMMRQAQTNLVDFFGSDRLLHTITPGDADAWRLYLVQQGLAESTIRRRCGRAKQFFRSAVRHKLISDNPFEVPMHVVCKWVGNSEPVAAKHYLQVTDEHYEKAAQNAAQCPSELDRTGQEAESVAPAIPGEYGLLHHYTNVKIAEAGFEPARGITLTGF